MPQLRNMLSRKSFYCSLFLLLLNSFLLHSQTLTGTVYDENRQTIPGASVYLDGTSVGTVTDEKGNYELTVKNKINTILVIAFIGYESKFIEKPFDRPAAGKLYLLPKATALREVTIIADGFTRAQKLAIFRSQFLGQTKGGKSCKILNEDAISFQYDSQKFILTASSDVPLRIQNKYLGYDIWFNLINFNIIFNRKSISLPDVYSSYFAGTTIFAPLPGKEASYVSKRKKTYLGSQMLFFRNLKDNLWGKKDFELYNGSFPANPADYFKVVKGSGVYAITVKPNVKTTGLLPEGTNFYSAFNLLYNRSEQSKVIFKTEKFQIDEYGNTSAPDLVLFSGEIGKYRVGDLLPLDFQP